MPRTCTCCPATHSPASSRSSCATARAAWRGRCGRSPRSDGTIAALRWLIIIGVLEGVAGADVAPAIPVVTTTEPGAHGDPIRALELDPELTTSTALAIDGLAIRGATPAEARVLVDGFDVPLLFHFGARGLLPDEALQAAKLT